MCQESNIHGFFSRGHQPRLRRRPSPVCFSYSWRVSMLLAPFCVVQRLIFCVVFPCSYLSLLHPVPCASSSVYIRLVSRAHPRRQTCLPSTLAATPGIVLWYEKVSTSDRGRYRPRCFSRHLTENGNRGLFPTGSLPAGLPRP